MTETGILGRILVDGIKQKSQIWWSGLQRCSWYSSACLISQLTIAPYFPSWEWSFHFPLVSVFLLFKQEGKSDPCYSILNRSRTAIHRFLTLVIFKIRMYWKQWHFSYLLNVQLFSVLTHFEPWVTFLEDMFNLKSDCSALKLTGYFPDISLSLLITINAIAMATPSTSLGMSVS